jgi:SAM-dependent methyltransferase
MFENAQPPGGSLHSSLGPAPYKNEGNGLLLSLIPGTSGSILDVGCGAGDNARILNQRGFSVSGITRSSDEAKLAGQYCKDVFLANLEESLPEGIPTNFDGAILSHVLEHLSDPWLALSRVAAHVKVGGFLVIAVPNMAHWRLRWRFLKGDWHREDHGPMDRTHLRFWSYSSLRQEIAQLPLEIEVFTGDFSLPLFPLRRLAQSSSAILDRTLGPLCPEFSAVQTVVLCRKRP